MPPPAGRSPPCLDRFQPLNSSCGPAWTPPSATRRNHNSHTPGTWELSPEEPCSAACYLPELAIRITECPTRPPHCASCAGLTILPPARLTSVNTSSTRSLPRRNVSLKERRPLVDPRG